MEQSSVGERETIEPSSSEPTPAGITIVGGNNSSRRLVRVLAVVAVACVALAVLALLRASQTTGDREDALRRDQAVTAAVKAINEREGVNLTGVGQAVNEIESVPSENTSRSAEYVATWYYVQVSDPVNARLHLDRLKAAEMRGDKLDADLSAMAATIDTKSLNESVKFLESNKGGGGVTGG